MPLTGRYANLLAAVAESIGAGKPYKPWRYLEVGVWDGRHSAEVLRHAHVLGRTHVEYYGFDLFEDWTSEVNEAELGKKVAPPTLAEVYARLEPHAALVRLVKGNTRHTLPAVAPTLPPMNLVFVDGGHSPETVASDWQQLRQLLHGRSVVLFDDYFTNRDDFGCRRLVDQLAADPRYQVALLDPEEYFPHTDLKIRMAKLNLQPR